MSDTATAAANGPQQAQAPRLRINAQYIKDLSFENPNAPGSLRPRDKAPKIDLDVNIDIAKVAEHSYEVALRVKADAKHEEEQLFIAELVYGGVFTLETEDQNQLEQVLMMYCPNLLFPFARQILANAATQGGFPPLMLEPIDFSALYARHKAQHANQGTA